MKSTENSAGNVRGDLMERIYMDHAATTPVDPRVLKAMEPYFLEKFGNTSSTHFFGEEALDAIEKAREEIAKIINAEPEEIIFTSGGTEADNIALHGAMHANKEKGNRLVTTTIEHHAIIHSAEFLQKQGFESEFLPVTKDGLVEISSVENALKKKTALVSVMHANNEIGTIQPIGEIGGLCRANGTLFHSDAVQTMGKEKIDVRAMNLDLLSASAHKFYGPKGVGFLFKAKNVKLNPIMQGGGHEQGLRPSTVNVPGIVGMAEALKIASNTMEEENAKEKKLRDMLIDGALEIRNSWVNGAREPRMAGNAALGFDFVEGQSLLIMLSDKGIAVSTGSACNSKGLKPSHVLMALGLPHVKCHGSLRFTLGRSNTKKHVEYVLEVLPGIVERLREISPLGGE